MNHCVTESLFTLCLGKAVENRNTAILTSWDSKAELALLVLLNTLELTCLSPTSLGLLMRAMNLNEFYRDRPLRNP